MLEIQRILCPIDFTNSSLVSLETANRLALHFASEILLLHVVSSLPPFPAEEEEPEPYASEDHIPEMMSSSNTRLRKLAQKSLQEGVSFRTLVTAGDAADEILTVATKMSVNWIILAAPTRSRLKKLLSASVTERVIRQAPCPVLAIPV